MSKTWVWLGIVVVLFATVFVAACGSGTTATTPLTNGTTTAASAGPTTTASAETTTTTEPFPTTAPAPTTTTAATGVRAWGEAVETHSLTVTADAPKEDTKAPLPKEGEKRVYCMVTIVNNGSEPYEYNPLYSQMFDAESQPYDVYPSTSQPLLDHGFLLPGRTIKAAVPFSLPKTAEPATLIFTPVYGTPEQVIWGK